MQQSFSNMAIEVVAVAKAVAMDALESSRGALFIGIDFCESYRVQLSELTRCPKETQRNQLILNELIENRI